jgi:hypothetical protein
MVQFPGDSAGGGEPAVDPHLWDAASIGGAGPEVVGAGAVDESFEALGQGGHAQSLPNCLVQSYALGYARGSRH